MSDKIQDSLDDLPQRQRSISPKQKEDKQKSLLFSIKQKFIAALTKLQNSQTRELALKQIRNIIDKNRTSQHLRMYISILKSLKIQGTSSSTKEHEVLVFSILAQLYKTNLIDPIDKPNPTIIKTVFKIIEMLHLYFMDSTNTVQIACARVLIDLGKYVLQTESESSTIQPNTIVSLLFSPLISILKTGVDKASQSTASVCINQLILYWKSHLKNQKYQECLNQICPEMLTAALRLNCEYHQLFSALHQLIDLKGMQFFKDKLFQFVGKILGVINKAHNKDEAAHNFNSYMSKVNVCRILQRIGTLIQSRQELKNKLNDLDVQICLEKASRNRVIQVQTAAHRALKAWKGQPIPQYNTQIKRPSGRSGLLSLEKARNNKKKERSTSRQERMKLQNQLNYMQEDLNKLVKGGWGPHKRANNYIKKNTGVGGGYSSKMETSPPSKPVKSHKEHIEELRSFIKKSAQQHSNEDKFSFYPEKNESKKIEKSKKKQQKRKKNNEEEQLEFQLEEEAGDQMVQLDDFPKNPYVSAVKKPQKEKKQSKKQGKPVQEAIKTENMEEYMNQNEMKELLEKENQLLDWDKKQSQDLVFGSLVSDIQQQIEEVRALNKSKKQNKDVPKKPSQKRQSQKQEKKQRTQNYVETQSLDFNNLSRVSSNFDGLLNESEIKALNFNANPQNSLGYTDSRGEKSTLRPKQQIKSEFTLNPQQGKQIYQSEPKVRAPQLKYNSFQPLNEKQEEEIEEKLDESIYQESYPQNTKQFQRNVQPNQNINQLFKKSVEHGFELQRKVQMKNQQKSHIYQEMIKNPPRSHQGHRLDKVSYIGSQDKNTQQEEIEEQDENITDTWEKVLNFVEQDQLNEAFTLVFEMDDPIYLLRLMLLTQIPLKKLTPTNSCRLWQKFLEIYSHRFIDNIFVQMFTHANELNAGKGLKNSLSIEETNDLLVELYELSGRTKGKLSYSSANLYNLIDQSIHGRND